MHELIFSRGVNGFLKVEGGGQVEMQVFSNVRLLLYQKVCVLGGGNNTSPAPLHLRPCIRKSKIIF